MGVYYTFGNPRRKKSFFDKFSVNTWLILINVIVFVAVTSLWFFESISVDAIAIKPSNIFQGQYLWTFLTSMFMHGGFFHLFVNMISLLFIGSLLQKILGSKRYLAFYLIAGLFAGLFFVLTSKFFFIGDFNTYAVGASGALFGLVGLLILLTPNLPVMIMFIPIPIKMKYAGPGILVLLWFISIAGNVPIGNTAHFGGLLAGLVYGIYLRNKFPNKVKQINQVFS